MSIHPVIGEFGRARVCFAYPGQAIPPELAVEFELLRLTEREPDREWIGRLERYLRCEGAAWYLLRTATRQEKRACESLAELVIEHYMPAETVLRKLNRKVEPCERALFPGYLFAQIPDDAYHAATHAAGAHAVVSSYSSAGERRPRRIDPRLVAELRSAQDRGEFDRRPAPPRAPEVGDTVHVTSGTWEGKIGALLEMRPKERVAVLLGSMIVEIAMAQFEVAA